jgi:hypothetical protein
VLVDVCVGSGSSGSSGTVAAPAVGVAVGVTVGVAVGVGAPPRGTTARVASPGTVGAAAEGVDTGNLSAVRPVTLVPAVAAQPSVSAYAAAIANGTSAIAVATVEITTRRHVTGAIKTVQSGRYAAEAGDGDQCALWTAPAAATCLAPAARQEV